MVRINQQLFCLDLDPPMTIKNLNCRFHQTLIYYFIYRQHFSGAGGIKCGIPASVLAEDNRNVGTWSWSEKSIWETKPLHTWTLVDSLILIALIQHHTPSGSRFVLQTLLLRHHGPAFADSPTSSSASPIRVIDHHQQHLDAKLKTEGHLLGTDGPQSQSPWYVWVTNMSSSL